VAGGLLRGGDEFVNMGIGSSDGIRTDVDGNLWSAAGWGGPGYDGVHVFAPNGDLIGQIHLPEPCANLCFGGRKKDRLFMTCGQSLYAVFVGTRGAQTP
jgi:gluconolactonase